MQTDVKMDLFPNNFNCSKNFECFYSYVSKIRNVDIEYEHVCSKNNSCLTKNVNKTDDLNTKDILQPDVETVFITSFIVLFFFIILYISISLIVYCLNG